MALPTATRRWRLILVMPTPGSSRPAFLFGNGTVGKEGKTVAPGAAEALNKYLAIAPNGPHAEDARQMLAFLAGPATR